MLRRAALILALSVLTVQAAAQSSTAAPGLSGQVPVFKVGDSWLWVRSDRRTGLKEAETSRTITKVSPERIEGTDNGNAITMTADQLALMETADFVRQGSPHFVQFPLELGKKWSFKYVQASKAGPQRTRWQYDAEVVGQERVKVPAGEFDAFKVVCKGYWNNEVGSGNGAAEVTLWFAPAARATVKSQFQGGQSYNVSELVEMKLMP